jgi:predicted ester cyclase
MERDREWRPSSFDHSGHGAQRRITTSLELTTHFRAYIRMLNTRSFVNLTSFVSPRIQLDGKRITLAVFERLVMPGVTFTPGLVVADVAKRVLAVRLEMTLTPQTAAELSKASTSAPSVLNGPAQLSYDQHVFYHFNEQWLIDQIFTAWCYGRNGTTNPTEWWSAIICAKLPEEHDSGSSDVQTPTQQSQGSPFARDDRFGGPFQSPGLE